MTIFTFIQRIKSGCTSVPLLSVSAIRRHDNMTQLQFSRWTLQTSEIIHCQKTYCSCCDGADVELAPNFVFLPKKSEWLSCLSHWRQIDCEVSHQDVSEHVEDASLWWHLASPKQNLVQSTLYQRLTRGLLFLDFLWIFMFKTVPSMVGVCWDLHV